MVRQRFGPTLQGFPVSDLSILQLRIKAAYFVNRLLTDRKRGPLQGVYMIAPAQTRLLDTTPIDVVVTSIPESLFQLGPPETVIPRHYQQVKRPPALDRMRPLRLNRTVFLRSVSTINEANPLTRYVELLRRRLPGGQKPIVADAWNLL